jgi:glycerol-1-phosphate dehydrogenase [NAD(P)+]
MRAALAAATDTRALVIQAGATSEVPALLRQHFGAVPARVVADPRTFAAAGDTTLHALRDAGVRCREPVIIDDPRLHAEWRFLEQVEAAVGLDDAIPVAVGSGTINDLVKLAAYRTGRQYLAMATAASMDGYTAFGASIIRDGSKQTFHCPAPRAVVADLNVIAAAPAELNAAGYADLMAKVTAGADWILADALGVDPIDDTAWRLVQGGLGEALADPEGVAHGDASAVARLVEGLMLGGFAMQHTRTSRPASGAEHSPSHGFKVGIATVAVVRLYEQLLEVPLDTLDVEARVSDWPAWPETAAAIEQYSPDPALRAKSLEETRAKHPSRETLREHLRILSKNWPQLRSRLREQLPPSRSVVDSLAAVGAPTKSEDIGISAERLEASHLLAYYLRRRYTVLDLAARTGFMPGSR